MPAINVAKTDTFEVQRQKINQIGSALFSITQGGSDLNTEILKIGDGSVSSPSLSFNSSPKVGFYRPLPNILGIASSDKKVSDFSSSGITSFQNIIVQKNSVNPTGFSILNFGSNYDTGTYPNVALTGGSGQNAEATIVVTEYSTSTISLGGPGYTDGDYVSISLLGGTGNGATLTFTVSGNEIESFDINNKGSGYSVGDILSLPETVSNVSTTVDTASSTITVPANVIGLIAANSSVVKVSGTGDISATTKVFIIDTDTNTITLSENPTVSGSIVLNFVPSFGDPAGNFQVEIDALGVVESVEVTSGGVGYDVNDQLSVTPTSLTQPITYQVINRVIQVITFASTVSASAFPVGSTIVTVFDGGGSGTEVEIYYAETTGGNIDYLVVGDGQFENDSEVTSDGFTTYSLQSASLSQSRFFIDTGSGPEYLPDITLFKDNKYIFDYTDSSNNGHLFSLSRYPDGIWSPSYIQNISTTLSTSSSQITVSDTTGILEGMNVAVESGPGELFPNTIVSQVINSTTILLNSAAKTAGTASLSFRGKEYTENVIRTETTLELIVTDITPTLYYYCGSTDSGHENEGGNDFEEVPLTVDLNNPKVFGSGFNLLVAILDTQDVIKSEVESGTLTAIDINSTSGSINTLEVSNTLTSNQLESISITTDDINSDSVLSITASSVDFTANLNIGSTITANQSTGNITTPGVLKTTGSLNISDKIIATENEISTVGQNNLNLVPASGRAVKVDSTTALIIPSGNTNQRPITGVVEDGAIRFNNETGQYEGYNSGTTSWSSLGGVRDLDNNTYIIAELTVGLNDNTLWFFNDDINTFRFGTEYQTFYGSKKIRSLNTSAPVYTNWTTNAPVTAGQFLKYRNDIYLVVNGGTTGTSGNEPNDVSGNTFLNGSATLQYSTTAVAPLTFEEISEVRIAPLGGTSLSINNDLRLSNNNISTDISDVLITPALNRKAKINTKTSLVIPVGTDSEKGSPEVGSIRYNTTINQFEGFNGSLNWTSLGGVRDVDGNTYIIPESAPGLNENILYFYNDDSNTLRVTTNQIELDTIDTIASTTSNILNVNASLVAFDSLSFSIDNGEEARTFLSATKPNLDLGISTGLNNETVLRIEDTGDLYYNIGYGSGTYTGVRIFDKNLKNIEIADFKITTSSVTLVKGTSDSSNTIIYNPSISASAKVLITAHNLTTGDKEFFEFSVIDEVNDVYYTEYGNIKTGIDLITTAFSIVPTGVRLTYTLSPTLTSGDNVVIKIISQITKR